MAELHMLTTIDNPYSPYTQYDQWLAFDEEKGYNSNALLARLVISSDELSDPDQNLAREDAIQQIIDEDVTDKYIKISREDKLK